jgi:aminoglycoside 3-N-acetyltransferase
MSDDHVDCRQAIAADLRELGVRAGDTILVHSSFKSLGPVPGGIETVVQGFLLAVGSEGTLLMPTLSWALRPPEVFDVRLTPSNVGAIPEYFRTRDGTTRSLHPTHSVCAVGRRTHELLDDHRLDGTPCGRHSPFHKLVETSGKIMMLGCGLGANTAMHALEEYVEPPYLYGATCRYTLRDAAGNTWEQEYKTHGFAGYAQRYDRVAELDTVSFLRRGQVLQASTFVLDAPRLRSAVLRKLEQDPCFFVQAQPK